MFENDGTFGDYQPGRPGFSGMASNHEIANILYLQALGSNAMFVSEAPSNPIVADFHVTAAGAATFGIGKGLPYLTIPILTAPRAGAREIGL
jgi:hypothetical protein